MGKPRSGASLRRRKREWRAVESSTASSAASRDSVSAPVCSGAPVQIEAEIKDIVSEICATVCAECPAYAGSGVEPGVSGYTESCIGPGGLGVSHTPLAVHVKCPVPRTYGVIAPPATTFKVPRTTLYSRWETITNGWKQAWLRCFCLGDAVDEWVCDDDFRQEVRDEMLLSCAVTSSGGSDEDQSQSDNASEAEAPELGRVLCETYNTSRESGGTHHVEVVPRIVALCVVALRMRLGLGATRRTGPQGPGNVAMVQQEAPRMLKSWGMRDMDAAAHLYPIQRAFFEEDAHFRVPTWRARACAKSPFVRWVLGKSEPLSLDC